MLVYASDSILLNYCVLQIPRVPWIFWKKSGICSVSRLNLSLYQSSSQWVQVKGLDANRYATKKTVAQGMLDIALLTSNASQLKYVLQVGPKHEFYMLLLVLISVSIILQVAMGLVLLTLNLLRDCRFHEPQHRNSALNINYSTTATAFVVTVLNILVSAFDSSLARYLEID